VQWLAGETEVLGEKLPQCRSGLEPGQPATDRLMYGTACPQDMYLPTPFICLVRPEDYNCHTYENGEMVKWFSLIAVFICYWCSEMSGLCHVYRMFARGITDKMHS
jgi:hypothetical protein